MSINDKRAGALQTSSARRGTRRAGKIPQAAIEAAERGECAVAVWPETKETILTWPDNTDWERGAAAVRARWPRPGRKITKKTGMERIVPELCAAGILTGHCGKLVIDIDSQAAEDWIDDLAAGRDYGTRILYTSIAPDGFEKYHLIYKNDTGKKFRTCAKPVIKGAKIPVDIRGWRGMEKIWDPAEKPEREFDDTSERAVPGWLAEVLPLFDEPAERLEDGSSDLDLERFLREGIENGSRNEDGFRLALSMRNKGVPLDVWMSIAKSVRDKSGTSSEFPDSMLEDWWVRADSKVRKEEAEHADMTDYLLNDAGNALRLQDLHGDDMLYVPEIRTWLVWDGRVWADDPAAANACAVDVSDALHEQADRIRDKKTAAALRRFATNSGNDAKITAMLRQTAALPDMGQAMHHFDADPRLLTVRNGTLILGDDVEFREHDRADYCRVFVPTEYDPDAESELWLDVLDKFVPDPEVREYLQRLAGYTLFGANSDRKIVFLKGPSSTGKTTFLKIMTRVLGADVAGPFMLSLFRDRGQDAPRPDLLRAMGRRFIHTTEASSEWRLHADTIKRVTGGDQLTARGMFSNKFVERTASFTPWIATNAYPHIEHADSALWRRLVAIPFEEVVPDAADDPRFTLSFPRGELPGVLRWMADGWRMYSNKGLDGIPEPVRNATAALRVTLSTIDQWIAGRCETGPDFRYPAMDLFYNFQGWCDEEGIPERERHTQTAFGRALSDRGFWTPDRPERVGPRSESKKVRMRHGLRIYSEDR